MNPGGPSNMRVVIYFFLFAVIVGFLSMVSPASFGEVREIPRSSSWGDPLVVDELSLLLHLPSCVIDPAGRLHVGYLNKIHDHYDIFHVTIEDGTPSDPRNLTNYPSLKKSVNLDTDSFGELYVVFLDNREERWQVFLLDVTENNLIQLTDTDTHKEDVFLSIGPENTFVITWTEVVEGKSRVALCILDPWGDIRVKKYLPEKYPLTKASCIADTGTVHLLYLENRVYDHVIYTQYDFSGMMLTSHDLGECIHKEAVSRTGSLGIFTGPQFVGDDTTRVLWSDFRTGAHVLYHVKFDPSSGEITEEGELRDFPLHGWSWMPSISSRNGITHIAYVNNGYGHRVFHSKIEESYRDLGTITSGRERGTAPVLLSDDKGFLHALYLRFEEGYTLIYRNTYPTEEKEKSLSERIGESSTRYFYSFALSFLYSFPLMIKDNFWGLCLLVAGFFTFRFFHVEKTLAKWKRSDYLLLVSYIIILFFLRGPIEYSPLALVIYEDTFVFYGFFLCFGASLLFHYLLRKRFDYKSRVLLSSVIFLYLFTLFLLVPVIPHM
jgi:hypothetical protein